MSNFPESPIDGALAEVLNADGSAVTYKYDKDQAAWKIVGKSGDIDSYITTLDVQTTSEPPVYPAGFPGLRALPDIQYLTNQKLVNWTLAEEIIANKQLIEELVWIGDNPPALGPEGEQLYTFWYDTTILDLFIWHNSAWFPTSASSADYGLEIEQFQYEVNRLQALLDELYLFTQTTNERLDGIDNDIIELEEEIEALAPSLERGQWTYNPLGSAGIGQYALYDSSGNITSDFNSVATIFINTVDSNSVTHGFDDVSDGSYLEIFEDTDADFGLFQITDVDDQTGGNTSFWSLTVDFVKSNSLTSTADGLARFKIFELAEAADPTSFVMKAGDNMEGTLDMKGETGRHKIINLSTPTSDFHAANKIYVDDQDTELQTYVDDKIAELLAKIEELEMAGGIPENYQLQLLNKSSRTSGKIGDGINANQILSCTQRSFNDWSGSNTNSFGLGNRHMFICLSDDYQFNSGFMTISGYDSSDQYSRSDYSATCSISEVEVCPPEYASGKNIYRAKVQFDGWKKNDSSAYPGWSNETQVYVTFTGGSLTKVS